MRDGACQSLKTHNLLRANGRPSGASWCIKPRSLIAWFGPSCNSIAQRWWPTPLLLTGWCRSKSLQTPRANGLHRFAKPSSSRSKSESLWDIERTNGACRGIAFSWNPPLHRWWPPVLTLWFAGARHRQNQRDKPGCCGRQTGIAPAHAGSCRWRHNTWWTYRGRRRWNE